MWRSGGRTLRLLGNQKAFQQIAVTDTGCGIKQEHRDHIFEPIFSTKPVGKGTGLGLSVSYGIVQQHGGWLEVESEACRGTTFTIILPTADTSTANHSDQLKE